MDNNEPQQANEYSLNQTELAVLAEFEMQKKMIDKQREAVLVLIARQQGIAGEFEFRINRSEGRIVAK